MKISAHTHCYAVLGHPVGHSLSPPMHNAALREMGLDAVYLAFDVLPEDLLATLGAMRRMGFRGVNLTVPLKEVAFAGIDDLDESARLLGSVNTVLMGARGLRGACSDGYGFLHAYAEAFGGEVAGRRIAIVGTGGAGRAIALAAADAGAAELALVNRSAAKAAKLAEEIEAKRPGPRLLIPEGDDATLAAIRDSEIVVQCTSLGLKPGDPEPPGPGAFHPGQQVMDIVYRPAETPFLRAARESGARTANGLPMLLHQGVRSLALWTNAEPPVETMRQALLAEVAS